MEIENQELIDMYRTMLTIRRFEERAIEEYQNGNLYGFIHSYIGQEAIATGVFEGGGKKYPCGEYVNEATSLFLNRFADTYQRIAGGALAWDTIILTVGGSALLQQKLLPILKHENVVLADQLDSLHLANVRGGFKLWRLYDALKLL